MNDERSTSSAEHVGAQLSLAIGFPVGLAAVGGTIGLTAWISGHGVAHAYVRFFGEATFWLLLVFPLALWSAGAMTARAICLRRSSLATRFRYSLCVNAPIWLTFALVYLLSSADEVHGSAFLWSNLVLPLSLGALSVLGTPFTIGRLIHEAIERRASRQESPTRAS